jgi:lipopolysaccharide biosynthesis protein
LVIRYEFLAARYFSNVHALANSKVNLQMSDQNSSPSLAVVLHLSNLDLWPQYWTVLKQLPTETSFFVSTSFDKKMAVQQLVQKDIGSAQFYAFESKGHDFGALISLLKLAPIHQFDLVHKLHTGNTDFYSDVPNERWLLEVLGTLLPIGRLNQIINYFRKNPSVGFAGPKEQHWPLKKLFYIKNWQQCLIRLKYLQ